MPVDGLYSQVAVGISSVLVLVGFTYLDTRHVGTKDSSISSSLRSQHLTRAFKVDFLEHATPFPSFCSVTVSEHHDHEANAAIKRHGDGRQYPPLPSERTILVFPKALLSRSRCCFPHCLNTGIPRTMDSREDGRLSSEYFLKAS
jgi:hypothetical protein